MASAPSIPHTGARHRQSRQTPAAVRRPLLAVAIAVPYLVVVFANQAGQANIDLDALGATIRWGADDLTFVRDLYPPLPTGLAGILPGGPLALGVVGALLAAAALEFLVERLRQRGFAWWFVAPVVAGIGASPVYVRTATTDLAAFMGLVAVLLAIAGLLEFTGLGDTGGGFRAGLALGVGVACDLGVAVYAVAIGIAAPLIARSRYRGQPHATQAAMLVLLFPTAAALLGWAYLGWRFGGSAFHAVDLAPGGFSALPAVAAAVAMSPVFLLSAAVLVRRNPPAAVALSLPLLGLLVGAFLGMTDGRGPALIVLALVGAFTIAPDPSRVLARWYALAVVLQIGLAALL